jgi:hypothetical protein
MDEEDILDEQEFYELMQAYRLAPLVDQERVVYDFEEVKKYIRAHIKEISDAQS